MITSVSAAQAPQAQCGIVQSIRFPVDTNVFQLVQDYGAASVRHDGRYHTGEDWFGGRDVGLGQSVRAIAAGRVVYASPTGWGRDGGVVILEHVFPDESTAYSVYGHIGESGSITFPAPFTCVNEGDVIGAIADVRPAPHVHFEIKTANPSLPGNGYAWQDPFSEGWRDPSKFVHNWQTWLNTAHAWHVDFADENGPITPPLELTDGGLTVLDANRLSGISPDGRVLWRTVLERPAVGLFLRGDVPTVVYADGGVQAIGAEGALGEIGSFGVAVDSSPTPFAGLLLFHTPDNRLIAVDPNTLATRWMVNDIAPVIRTMSSAELIALITNDGIFHVIAADGSLLNNAQLRDGGALAATSDGSLMAYTRGGLWRINLDGSWLPMIDAAPQGSRSASFAISGNTLYLFDGLVLRAMDATGNLAWEVALPGVDGLTETSVYGNVILLLSTHGHIMVLEAGSGGLCNQTRIYGDDGARLWHRLGSDGTLRIAIADQVLGLDWQTFLGACR